METIALITEDHPLWQALLKSYQHGDYVAINDQTTLYLTCNISGYVGMTIWYNQSLNGKIRTWDFYYHHVWVLTVESTAQEGSHHIRATLALPYKLDTFADEMLIPYED